MDFNKFTEEVHVNAVEHGWWDENRSAGEVIALCHSEISEALEEYRAGRPNAYVLAYDGECPRLETRMELFGDNKPEGIAVEFADVIIRCLDWFGKMGINAHDLLNEAIGGERRLSDFPIYHADNFGEFIAALHTSLSLAHRRWCNASGIYSTALRMAVCCTMIFAWADDNGVDLEKILRVKHEYNKGRPYKHGKVR